MKIQYLFTRTIAFFCAFLLLTVSLAVGTPVSAGELLPDVSDNMPDKWEIDKGLNPVVFDAYDDPDNDGLPNVDEYLHDTNPQLWDTDDDGMPDAWEVRYDLNPKFDDSGQDADNDGLSNIEEFKYGLEKGLGITFTQYINNFHMYGVWWNGTNPRKWDMDGDGISDYDESELSGIYYIYEKIEAEYYFDNSVVFSKTYFISSDNSAIHLEDKSMAIPIMMATPSWMIMVM